MSSIVVANLQQNEEMEIVSLKAEAEKGNPEAITAFKSLRGGLTRNTNGKYLGTLLS